MFFIYPASSSSKSIHINIYFFTYIHFIMAIKLLLILALAILAQPYTIENQVLILTDEDLPGVTKEFEYILIEFYAPWCGHCKKLSPIYDEVAKELHESGSPVVLAKINADEYSSVKGGFQISGFPTLIFFNNGQQIKYSGQRTKEVMVSWLNKKTRPSVIALEASQLGDLSNQKVNILLHTNDAAEHDQAFTELANLDDYNTYYSVKGTDQPAGTVQIFRPFGETQSTTVSDSLKQWISTHDRPLVAPFDDRTISSIFAEKKVGVILFHSASADDVLSAAFTDAANEVRNVKGQSQLVFTGISIGEEHYNGLANYIKVLTEKSPVIIINGGDRSKYILEGQAAELTAEQIVTFVDDFSNGKLKKYKMDEEVTYSDSSKVEEEL